MPSFDCRKFIRKEMISKYDVSNFRNGPVPVFKVTFIVLYIHILCVKACVKLSFKHTENFQEKYDFQRSQDL